MALDEGPLGGERHGIGDEAGFEVLVDFPENPGRGHGAAAEHDSGDAGLLAAALDGGGAGEVAIADDGDVYSLDHLADDIPIGFAAVALGLGAAMDGDGPDSGVLKEAGGGNGVDGGAVPADANFCRDREGRGGADDGAGDALEQGAIAQEGGAAVLADDFIDGAAEIEVEEVGLLPLDGHAGGLGEVIGVAAEELDAEGTLGFMEVEVLEGACVAAEDALGRNELSDDDIGALLLAEAAENGVRDPGHRGEVERETVLKPREHRGECNTIDD